MTRDGEVRGLSAQALRSLVGGRVERIRLWSAEDADEELSGDELAGVVDVDHGVVVSTTAGELALAWRIDGYYEYLSAVGDPAASPAARVNRMADVSDGRPWRGLIGATVTGVGTATAEAEDGSKLLWSVRLETDAGPSLTVALGETEDGAVEYRPSNLVAVFDRRVAETYAIEPGGESAWGTDFG
ncbi:hypothetical protein AB0C29_16245 [Actinoplanes sp. NPDC048791]|uniref:hypothetical protein n=1 Tax=Actinoplanes sp. NPDC048791 TaxID=3154623 RepID=UPI0033C49C19